MSTSLLLLLFLSTLVAISELTGVGAVGGIAEMKALTGDAPYLGTGNQEQAPEYFGPALYRAYYDPNARSRYWSNYYNSDYNNFYPQYYRAPYSGDSCCDPAPASAPIPPPLPAPASAPSTVITSKAVVSSPTGGGFYSGGGNDWVKN